MIGGTGDDYYLVQDANTVVVEAEGEGLDTVGSIVSYGLSDHVEKLILNGNSDISGTGNAQDNAIIGNSGANTLDGGGGADEMRGGLGRMSILWTM